MFRPIEGPVSWATHRWHLISPRCPYFQRPGVYFPWEGKKGNETYSFSPSSIIKEETGWSPFSFPSSHPHEEYFICSGKCCFLPWHSTQWQARQWWYPVRQHLCLCRKEAAHKFPCQLLQGWARSVVPHLHLGLNLSYLIWAFRGAGRPTISAVSAGIVRSYCSTNHSRIIGLLVLQLRVLQVSAYNLGRGKKEDSGLHSWRGGYIFIFF